MRKTTKHKTLNRIPARNILTSEAKQKSTSATALYKEILGMSYTREHNAGLRPSSFPLCSILVLEDLCVTESESPFLSNMYTSIGSVMHEMVQSWCAQANVKVWGDWDCWECKTTRQLTTENICPSCGEYMYYRELELCHAGVTGHVDLVVKDGDRLLVVDLKSASKWVISQPTYARLGLEYVLQLFSYSYLLQKVHGDLMKEQGLELGGCSLLFLNRDKPARSIEFTWPIQTALKEGRRTIHSAIIAYRKALEAKEKKDLNLALPGKLCGNVEHYDSEIKHFFYGGCRLEEICVKSKQSKHLYQHFDKLLT